MPALMIQGTASGVGKSLLTAALCRIFRQDGWRVAPFKSQNMNTDCVEVAGGLISRPQLVQARAAGVEPSVDMNPVVLRPIDDRTSDVVIHGKSRGRTDFRSYYEDLYTDAEQAIRTSLARLQGAYDIVVLEGAGSPAEVNLRERELVNMRVAAWADAHVLLVADVDRGGALAALVGTLALLEPHERARVAGLVINRFRGDVSLFEPAVAFLAERTGKPVLGVVPWIEGVGLPADAAQMDRELDRIAAVVRSALDVPALYRMLG